MDEFLILYRLFGAFRGLWLPGLNNLEEGVFSGDAPPPQTRRQGGSAALDPPFSRPKSSD